MRDFYDSRAGILPVIGTEAAAEWAAWRGSRSLIRASAFVAAGISVPFGVGVRQVFPQKHPFKAAVSRALLFEKDGIFSGDSTGCYTAQAVGTEAFSLYGRIRHG